MRGAPGGTRIRERRRTGLGRRTGFAVRRKSPCRAPEDLPHGHGCKEKDAPAPKPGNMPTLSLHTRTRRQMIDVTHGVTRIISESRCQNGLAVVTVLHTTCALLINDARSGWEEDMLSFIERIVPSLDFRHLHAGPEHAKSHILGALLGPTLTIGIEDGRPVLGTWQSLFMVEMEGPRERTISVQVIHSGQPT